jgi:hypothetical protein
MTLVARNELTSVAEGLALTQRSFLVSWTGQGGKDGPPPYLFLTGRPRRWQEQVPHPYGRPFD